jgi:hypothetical protein
MLANISVNIYGYLAHSIAEANALVVKDYQLITKSLTLVSKQG